MLRTTLRACALVFISASFAASAYAMPGNAPRSADPAERFAVMDTDSNGSISWKEFSAARPNLNENAFKSIDADANGGISLDEWKAFSSGHGGMSKKPDMGSMMKAMGGMGMASAIGPNAIPSDDDSAVPGAASPASPAPSTASSASTPSSTASSAPAMPLVMPPQNSAPSASPAPASAPVGMPLITPPAATAQSEAAPAMTQAPAPAKAPSASMPLIMPPKAGK